MYKKITSQKELDVFLDEVIGFHDSILKEMGILSRGYIDETGGLRGETEPYDARLFFQQQYITPMCFEVIFIEVFKISISSNMIEIEHGTYTDSKVELGFISAKSMMYRILGKEYLGNKLFGVDDFPYEDPKECKFIEDSNWIMCNKCSDAVEIPDNRDFGRCKKCGTFYKSPHSKPINNEVGKQR